VIVELGSTVGTEWSVEAQPSVLVAILSDYATIISSERMTLSHCGRHLL